MIVTFEYLNILPLFLILPCPQAQHFASLPLLHVCRHVQAIEGEGEEEEEGEEEDAHTADPAPDSASPLSHAHS